MTEPGLNPGELQGLGGSIPFLSAGGYGSAMKTVREELVEGFRDAWELFWAFVHGPRRPRRLWRVLMGYIDRVSDQFKSIR